MDSVRSEKILNALKIYYVEKEIDSDTAEINLIHSVKIIEVAIDDLGLNLGESNER